MPIVDGPTLDKLVKEGKEWYNLMRQRLITDLERDGYPYGTVKLTEEEQLYKYLAMSPMDWSDMTARLLQKYRGRVDALKLAGQDMQRYRQHMEVVKARHEARQGRPLTTSMESQAGSLMRQAGLTQPEQTQPGQTGGGNYA